MKSERLGELALDVVGVFGQKRPAACCESKRPGRRSGLREALESSVSRSGLLFETSSDAGLDEIRREHECDVRLADSRWRRSQLLQLGRGDLGSTAHKIDESQSPPRDGVCDRHAGLRASVVT